MQQNQTASEKVPFPIAMAASLVWLHGILMIINAVAIAMGMNHHGDLYSALLRMIGVSAVGWGLLNYQRWAWWLTVVLGGLAALSSLLGVAGLMFLESRRYIQGGGFNQIVLMINAIFLVAAIFYLMRPVSRAAFGFGESQHQFQSDASDSHAPPIPSPRPWSS